jgi:hypothetical protein
MPQRAERTSPASACALEASSGAASAAASAGASTSSGSASALLAAGAGAATLGLAAATFGFSGAADFHRTTRRSAAAAGLDPPHRKNVPTVGLGFSEMDGFRAMAGLSAALAGLPAATVGLALAELLALRSANTGAFKWGHSLGH